MFVQRRPRTRPGTGSVSLVTGRLCSSPTTPGTRCSESDEIACARACGTRRSIVPRELVPRRSSCRLWPRLVQRQYHREQHRVENVRHGSGRPRLHRAARRPSRRSPEYAVRNQRKPHRHRELPLRKQSDVGDGVLDRPAEFDRIGTADADGREPVGNGAQYYDTSLQEPVRSDGSQWRDASGSVRLASQSVGSEPDALPAHARQTAARRRSRTSLVAFSYARRPIARDQPAQPSPVERQLPGIARPRATAT